ncbi:MAG TPA: hypothetical protein VGC57_00295 [Cellulomonas sp.]
MTARGGQAVPGTDDGAARTRRDRGDGTVETVLSVVIAAVVLVGLAVLGNQVRGTTGAIVGVVAGLILLGVARMLLTLTGAREIARRRRARRAATHP